MVTSHRHVRDLLLRSRTQIHTDFHRKLNKYREDQHQKWLNEMCLSLSSLNLTPAPSRKSSDWTYEPTQRERSLSQESLESTVSNNSAATPTSIASTVTIEFEESERPLEYDADKESNKCPVFSCVKIGVHHGVPCDKNVPEDIHCEETNFKAVDLWDTVIFQQEEPLKTPPWEVKSEATQPEASPIKRRRTSSMEPLETKFQSKRRRCDALNTAFLYDSE